MKNKRKSSVLKALACAGLLGLTGLVDSCRPTHNSVSVEQTSTYKFPHFDWEDHPAQFADVSKPVNYIIQIASDKSFLKILDQDTIALSRYVHDRPFEAGTYYWRTKSLTFEGEVSDWSKATGFTISASDEMVKVALPKDGEDATALVQTAVKKAETLATSGKSVKLVFPKGDYYFNKELVGAVIQLKHVSNIEIEGSGATFHLTSRKQGVIKAEACQNISISGFNITYAKGVFRVQGHIKEVDYENRVATVTLEKDSPVFEASSDEGHDVFILLDPNINGRLKNNSSSFYRYSTKKKNEDGTYTFTIPKGDFNDWEVGGRFVFHFRSGSVNYIDFSESKHVTAYNVTTDGWGQMGFVAKKGSNYNILHCQTTMQEGKWMMGNADGVHIREHVVGPWIENTHIQGTGDDGLALYARPVVIASAKPNGNAKTAICDTVFFNFEKGNEVSFFEPRQGKILLETVVTDVQKQTDGKYLVTFGDALPDDMITGEALQNVKANEPKKNGGWDKAANQGKLQDRTQIWNRSKSCGEFVIRHSKFTNNRRYGSVFRSRRGLIENSIYKSSSSRAINFRNETAWPNGLYASEIIIKNNLIEDCGFDGTGKQAVVDFTFERRGGGIVQSIGARNLLIEGNTFKACASPEIGVSATKNVTIRKNKKIDETGQVQTVKYKSVRSENVIQEVTVN